MGWGFIYVVYNDILKFQELLSYLTNNHFSEACIKKIFAFLFLYMERHVMPTFYAIVCKAPFFIVSPYYKKGKLYFHGLASLIAMSGSCSFKESIKYIALTTIV